MGELFDLLIVGSGPAGLSAAIYATRAKLKTTVFERETLGGQPINTELIENYPGYDQGISGAELGSKMVSQAMNQGARLEFAEVQGIELNQEKTVIATTGRFSGRTLLIAGGAKPMKLGVPGEDDFAGKGVIYCAFCDGGRFVNQVVAVAGGGDSGITEALLLAKLVSRVIVIELMPRLTATKVLQERASSNPKIEIKCGVKIEAIRGDDQVKAIDLLETQTGERSVLEVNGILVAIGRQPNTAYLGNTVALDQGGQVIVNEYMETEVPGIFAAGDIRSKSPRQVATAVGDGVTAALLIIRYLQKVGSAS